MADLAIVIPTLGRAHALAPLLQNVADTTPAGTCLTIFVCDHDDQDTRTELQRLGAWWVFCDGTYPIKTNAGFSATDHDLVLVAGDDSVFHAGWYDAAVEAFTDPTAHVVGGPDMSPITENGAHVTMPIVRRSYINDPGGAWGDPGHIYHEGYHHNYTDTELWQLAQHRGVARFVPGCVIEHRHPLWGTAPMDATYAKGAYANEPIDAALFNQRRSQWAG